MLGDEELWPEGPLGVGSIQQLNDYEADVSRKLPLGFPIPQGDEMTAYRERMKAGVYEDKTEAKPPAKRRTAKRASGKRAASRKRG